MTCSGCGYEVPDCRCIAPPWKFPPERFLVVRVVLAVLIVVGLCWMPAPMAAVLVP